MIQTLTLKNFKSFSEPKGHKGLWEGASISFGGLSLIIGTNASGKSNIRDGLRFIHGISRGYSLSEIIGEKYVEGGVLQWKGIRGGVRETVTRNGGSATDEQFTIAVTTKLADEGDGDTARYSITVNLGQRGRAPRVVAESLKLGRESEPTFQITGLDSMARHVEVGGLWPPPLSGRWTYPFSDDRPVITQLIDDRDLFTGIERNQDQCRRFLRTISSVRFLDLDPNSLRSNMMGQTA